MKATLLVLFALVTIGFAAQQGTSGADLVLVNGRIYTVDPARPWAEAVAVRGDRIVAVGTTAEVKALAGSQARTIDLNGAFVSPGFNDAHVHIDSTGALIDRMNLRDRHEPQANDAAVRGAESRIPAGSWSPRG